MMRYFFRISSDLIRDARENIIAPQIIAIAKKTGPASMPINVIETTIISRNSGIVPPLDKAGILLIKKRIKVARKGKASEILPMMAHLFETIWACLLLLISFLEVVFSTLNPPIADDQPQQVQ